MISGPELNLTLVLNLASSEGRDYRMQDQVSGKLRSQESPEASSWTDLAPVRTSPDLG